MMKKEMMMMKKMKVAVAERYDEDAERNVRDNVCRGARLQERFLRSPN
jgi:anti-sigma factor RsiW